MALRSDAALLWDIRRLGGQLLRVESGEFWAIFDREYLEALGTESRSPVLTCRTCDAERLDLRKGVSVPVGDEVYRVHRHEPDGTGMTLLYLVS